MTKTQTSSYPTEAEILEAEDACVFCSNGNGGLELDCDVTPEWAIAVTSRLSSRDWENILERAEEARATWR